MRRPQPMRAAVASTKLRHDSNGRRTDILKQTQPRISPLEKVNGAPFKSNAHCWLSLFPPSIAALHEVCETSIQ